MKPTFQQILFVQIIYWISKTWQIRIQGELPTTHSIIVFWHGIMLPCWKIFTKKNAFAVVSSSKDGQILVDLLTKWGFSFIRGSSSKGGKEVLQNIIENSKSQLVLMTPDGPRGPINNFKPGAVVAAQRAKVPIYFLKATIGSKIIFKKSWDYFQFPMPFSKIKISVSEPIWIADEKSPEEINNIIREIEQRML